MKSSALITLIFSIAIAVLMYTLFFKYLPDTQVTNVTQDVEDLVNKIEGDIDNETDTTDLDAKDIDENTPYSGIDEVNEDKDVETDEKDVNEDGKEGNSTESDINAIEEALKEVNVDIPVTSDLQL